MKEVLAVKGKKAQITIFVIIALVIIVGGILIYIFLPSSTSTSGGFEENPTLYIQNCVEENLTASINKISMQGGSLNPEANFSYNSTPVEYLCYTNQYYSSPDGNCVIQRVNLRSHMESEIKNAVNQKLNDCFDEMNRDFTSKGYTVDLTKRDFAVSLLPNKILLSSQTSLELTKDNIQSYDSFNVVEKSNLYEILSIVKSIVAIEHSQGGLDQFALMGLLKTNFKIDKFSPDGGKTAIWTVSDDANGGSFTFATSEINFQLGYSANTLAQ